MSPKIDLLSPGDAAKRKLSVDSMRLGGSAKDVRDALALSFRHGRGWQDRERIFQEVVGGGRDRAPSASPSGDRCRRATTVGLPQRGAYPTRRAQTAILQRPLLRSSNGSPTRSDCANAGRYVTSCSPVPACGTVP
jgi:hypothetical protein